MRIKLLAGFSGADFSLSPGDETERFSNAEAVRMIKAGFAVPISEHEMETTERHAPVAEERSSRPPRGGKRA